MKKEYTTPALRVITFQQTDDIIQTSGIFDLMPKTEINGTLAEYYGITDFDVFQQ